MDRIRLFFRLLGISAKMDLAWLIRDTKYALLAISTELIANIASQAGIYLLAVRFGGVGGMQSDEVLFMMAYIVALSCLFGLFGSSNNGHISRIIGRGQLEHLMIQPVSLPMQLMTSGFMPFTSGSLGIILSLYLLFTAAARLGLAIDFLWALGLVGSLIVSLGIQVCIGYLFSAAAFYAPVAAEEITTDVYEILDGLSRYPLSGMPRFIIAPLLSLFPAGLIGWYPCMVLFGKPGFFALMPLGVLLLFFLITQFVFRKGFKHYVQTGANRYLPHGFRN